jgi:hypothetical protein
LELIKEGSFLVEEGLEQVVEVRETIQRLAESEP